MNVSDKEGNLPRMKAILTKELTVMNYGKAANLTVVFDNAG